MLITELAQEIKQHQDKIRQRINKLKSKISDTNEFSLDEYLRAGAEHIQKLEKYQSSLSSSAAVASAFIKTFLNFHGKNFPTWGEFNQKPLQENKISWMFTQSLRYKITSDAYEQNPAHPRLRKEFQQSQLQVQVQVQAQVQIHYSILSGTSTVTESLKSPLMLSDPTHHIHQQERNHN